MKIKINYLHTILSLKLIDFLNIEKIFLLNPFKILSKKEKKNNKRMQYILLKYILLKYLLLKSTIF